MDIVPLLLLWLTQMTFPQMTFLTEIGPKFGYYPEPTKTWLGVNKSFASEKIESAFFGTKIKIATGDRRYLYLKNYISRQKLMNGLASWSY